MTVIGCGMWVNSAVDERAGWDRTRDSLHNDDAPGNPLRVAQGTFDQGDKETPPGLWDLKATVPYR
jgi:hypothetical protein